MYMVEHYGWKCSVNFYDCAEDMPEGVGYECSAYTTADFKYLEAVVSVNLRNCDKLSGHEIEYVVIHELVHLLVSPLVESSEVTPHEYTVTSIARIIQGLRKE